MNSISTSDSPLEQQGLFIFVAEMNLKKAEFEKQGRKLLETSNTGAEYDEAVVIKNKMK